ncbi:MAG: TerB family tellurite resistance protein [Prevotella sp.]|jgi:DnaJ like chaperone protein|nr:TerB family tellurite resistance protein [Prevotella sp.]
MAIGKWLKGLLGSGNEKQGSGTEERRPGQSAEKVNITDEFRKTFSARERLSEEQRNSFIFSLLVMASYIVIADGRVDESETAYIGRFMGNNFGPEVEKESMEVLHKLLAKHVELHKTKPMAFIQLIGDCGQQMSKTLNANLRYQLLSMLVMISKSDEHLDDKELEALHDVSIYMGMKGQDVDDLLDIDPELAKRGWPDLNLHE